MVLLQRACKRYTGHLPPNTASAGGGKPMFKVGRTLILAVGFTALTFVPAAILASTARAQTMGEYGATVGSSSSSSGTLGSSLGLVTSNVGRTTTGGPGP